MADQAAPLRHLMRRQPQPAPLAGPSRPVVVLGSGKGGVGKSVLGCLLALELTHTGLQVLLFESDLNRGHLRVLLRVQPQGSLANLVRGADSVDQLLTPVAPGLWLLPADSGSETLYGMTPFDHARLNRRLLAARERFDLVLAVGGAAYESVTRVTAHEATHLIVVTTAEPAALVDAYALTKIVHLQRPGLPVDVLINRASSALEARGAFERLNLAAHRFLGRSLGYLGAVPDDPAIHQAVRRAGSILQLRSGPACEAVAAIATALADRIASAPRTRPPIEVRG